MSTNTGQIKITAEPSADPAVCKFIVDRPLHSDGAVSCRSLSQAEGSPLLEELFAVDGVREVLVFGNNVTVAKETDHPWQVVGKEIGAAIRRSFESGKPLIAENQSEKLPSEKELRDKIEALMDKEMNPYIASHGGRIEIVDVKGTVVYVSMSGGCQGCASASVTLRHGVERLIFENIPEVTEIIDVTDHSAGVNPYL